MNRVVGDGVDPVVTLLTAGCGQQWGRKQTPALSLTLPGQPHTPPPTPSTEQAEAQKFVLMKQDGAEHHPFCVLKIASYLK